MNKKTRDPIAPWFAAAEALGEYIGIRFGQLAPGRKEPEWTYLRHAEFDGIGGLADILRRRGASIDSLPQIKHPAPPSLLPLLKTAPKFLLPHQRVKLRPIHGNPRPSTHLEPPPAVAWHVFDVDATGRARQAGKRAGVTLNTFLLEKLTKAIRPQLADSRSMVPWMLPVNLRGKVVRERDTANYSSYVSVRIQPGDQAQDIHRKIYAALDRGDHWANWYSYELGCVAPHGIKKFLVARELAISHWNLGCFSNLGDWDPEKKITQPDCLGDWFFCPPVLRFITISAGCVTFQNRLSLLIQAHPELTTDPAVPRAWMDSWVKEIEA